MPTPSQRVLAIDPGDSRTGWARATLSENTITHLEHGVNNHMDFGLTLHHGMRECDPAEGGGRLYDVLVYETWLPRPKDGSMAWIQGNQLLAAQLIGQIRLAGWLYDAKLVGQPPSAKGPAVAQMLNHIPDEWSSIAYRSHEQHNQDAVMHLWSYFWTNWVSDPERIVVK